jgi:hypothetical protein
MSNLNNNFKIGDKVRVDPEWAFHNVVGEIQSIEDANWFHVRINKKIYICFKDDLHKVE